MTAYNLATREICSRCEEGYEKYVCCNRSWCGGCYYIHEDEKHNQETECGYCGTELIVNDQELNHCGRCGKEVYCE